MKAIILAAGSGSRMRLTTTDPKCLLPIDRSCFLTHAIAKLRHVGVKKIWIVVGYEWSQISEVAGSRCCYILNPLWTITNSIYSLDLGLHSAGVGEDIVVMNSDIYFHQDDLKYLIQGHADIRLLIGEHPGDDEATKVVIDGEKVLHIDQTLPEGMTAAGEYTGIAVISSTAVTEYHATVAVCAGRSPTAKWPCSLQASIDQGVEVEWKLAVWPWIEVDTPEDYNEARRLFG